MKAAIALALARHLATALGAVGVVVSDEWAMTAVSVLVTLGSVGWSLVRAKRNP